MPLQPRHHNSSNQNQKNGGGGGEDNDSSGMYILFFVRVLIRFLSSNALCICRYHLAAAAAAESARAKGYCPFPLRAELNNAAVTCSTCVASHSQFSHSSRSRSFCALVFARFVSFVFRRLPFCLYCLFYAGFVWCLAATARPPRRGCARRTSPWAG